MRRDSWLVLLAVLAVGLLWASSASAVSIVNGSMNHTGGASYLAFNGFVAPGWASDPSETSGSSVPSPDIFDPVMTWLGMAWNPSSDGGMFAHALGLEDGGLQEGIVQTITGLTIGNVYDLTFEQSITDTNFLTSGLLGQWQVRFGSTTQYSAVMTSPAQDVAYGWEFQTLSFTATATSQDLSFFAKSVLEEDPVYLGLDGVSIQERVVPEPSTGLLLGLGLIAITAARRPSVLVRGLQ